MIRLCLRDGVSPVFIPEREPQFNGSVKNFNGWFQEPLFQRHFQRPGDLRRQLARLQEAVNTQHVHPQPRGQTPGSTAVVCGCRSCPRVSCCRRESCRWPRGS